MVSESKKDKTKNTFWEVVINFIPELCSAMIRFFKHLLS